MRLGHDRPSAVEAAHALRPDAVLLDIGLPAMDGDEVARRLRVEAACRHATRIAVSRYGQARDVPLSREAGFDHHPVKPVDFDALASLLGRDREG